MRARIAIVMVLLVAAACSGDETMSWQDDLVDLSQGEYAAALYYQGEVDPADVDLVMDAQCESIDRALTDPAFSDDAALLSQLTVSIELQRDGGVPDEVIRRDYAMLDRGMQQRCPAIHARVSDYFPVDRFEDLVDCAPISIGDSAAQIADACSS